MLEAVLKTELVLLGLDYQCSIGTSIQIAVEGAFEQVCERERDSVENVNEGAQDGRRSRGRLFALVDSAKKTSLKNLLTSS